MTINVFGGGNTGGPAFPLQRSVRLRSSASAYFNRTPASAGNRKTWTWSGWVKRGTSGSYQYLLDAYVSTNIESSIRFTNTDNLQIYQFNASAQYNVITTQVFRDPSSWYHIFVAFDTTQASSSDRVKVYVNGVQVTAFSTAVYPSLNFDSYINNTYLHSLGRASNAGGVYYYDGYLTEVNFIDGQALTPSSFGSINSTTGVWQPIKYNSTYGVNGFYLNFQDNSAATAAAIGKDSSGNGNNWTPNNISVTAGVTYDSMLDVPTLTSATNANFCTLNPLRLGSVITASAGNLQFASSSGNSFCSSTIGMTSGKWYCEIFMTSAGTAALPGIVNENATTASYPGGNTNGYGYYYDGNKYTNGAGAAYGSSYTTNDTIGIAFDFDNGKVWFSKNGTWQASGDPAAGTNAAFTGISLTNTWFFACGNSGVTTQNINFGQRPFTYPVPTGFKSLNTYNLPAPTIPNGATQFAVSLWSGNNSTQSITNIVNGKSFQPDLVWLKQRSPTGTGHILEDSVRGALQYLGSESTAAESTIAGTVTAFNSNGFSIGSQAGTNATGSTYVGWQWKAGGTAVTNTSGSISSQVSANPSAGFSIVTYTGTGANATVGHGLGVAPKMVIVKNRSTSTDWGVWQTALAGTEYLILNNTNAKGTGATIWNSTVPTSSVISVGTNIAINASGNNHVAYCFSEIAGYSKFGSFVGTGSGTTAPFVYCGFRPRFIMFKCTTAAENWEIIDTSRNPSNVGTDQWLYANLSNAEGTTSAGASTDILSNGFKLRGFTGTPNTSGATYIFIAFAESPFNYSLAR